MKDYEFESGYERMELENKSETEAQAYNLKRFMERIKAEQNLPLAIVAGTGGAAVGALLWAAITFVTEYQIGFMAIGVGFLVGLAVRYLGKGVDQIFGIVGAGFSLIGCLVGNFLATALFIAKFESVPIFEVLITMLVTPALLIEIMVATFNLIDLLFYGLAIYQGYKLSFRQVTQAEMDKALGTGQPVQFN